MATLWLGKFNWIPKKFQKWAPDDNRQTNEYIIHSSSRETHLMVKTQNNLNYYSVIRISSHMQKIFQSLFYNDFW